MLRNFKSSVNRRYQTLKKYFYPLQYFNVHMTMPWFQNDPTLMNSLFLGANKLLIELTVQVIIRQINCYYTIELTVQVIIRQINC